MLFFLIKRTFINMWDNLVSMILINAGILFLGAALLALPSAIKLPRLLFYSYQIIAITLLSFIVAIVCALTRDYTECRDNNFREIFASPGKYLFPAIVNTSYFLFVYSTFTFVIPFYFSMNDIPGTLLGTTIFWVWLAVFLSGLYFFPVVFQLNKSIIEAVRVCFFLFFKNFFFSMNMLLVTIFIVIISAPFFFLLPGIATVSLWLNVCLKILRYKYAYLESHPEASPSKIPWSELLAEDKKNIGPRSWKSLLFPWK